MSCNLLVQLLTLTLILVSLGNAESVQASSVPDQIHLSLGADPSSMVLIWATASQTAKSNVRYGLSPDSLTVQIDGYQDSYSAASYKSPLFHYVIFTQLKPDTTYYYQCGDATQNVWSQVYAFKTQTDQKVPVTIGCIGDVGTTSHSKDTLSGLSTIKPSLIILVGDLSYADGYQPIWDQFGNMIQNYSVSTPWMYLPGNHENEPSYHFQAYEKRYLMTPGLTSALEKSYGGSGGGNFYYSFDYSWVHFIMLSSETDYSRKSTQYAWLQADLKSVDRESTPWVVVSWHRPWYSSNSHHQGEAEPMRRSIEDLLFQYKVDFCMNGHVHAYERTERMYNFTINPKGPYYFTIGDGGNKEGLATPWLDPQPEWSSFRLAAYGYSAFHVYNKTHIYWEMHRDDDFALTDSLWIVKQ